MVVGAHQPHYLPWLRYLEKIARCDAFVVLDNIQFSKNGWQNRNKVKGPNGPTLLTVPVHAPLGETIDRIAINNRANWRRKHWATIQQCYARAPYASDYLPFLESVYARDWDWLHELNRHMLNFYLDALDVRTSIHYSSELNVSGEATDRLVNLVKAVGGDAYYSGAYALDAYLDAATLDRAGIQLVLQEWTAPVYPQLHGEFVRDLSIVDLLMNCGPHARQVLLEAVEHAA
jgi:hypothetical protein